MLHWYSDTVLSAEHIIQDYSRVWISYIHKTQKGWSVPPLSRDYLILWTMVQSVWCRGLDRKLWCPKSTVFYHLQCPVSIFHTFLVKHCIAANFGFSSVATPTSGAVSWSRKTSPIVATDPLQTPSSQQTLVTTQTMGVASQWPLTSALVKWPMNHDGQQWCPSTRWPFSWPSPTPLWCRHPQCWH